MKTLLLGTDWVYGKNGNLIPIEINTNSVTGGVVIDYEIFNLNPLINLISTHNINKITYIGGMDFLNEKLIEFTNNNGLEYEFVRIINSGVVPYIEDSNTHLIIRSSYDGTAIVDDTYCRDKVNFMKLIQMESFGSQFAYKDNYGDLISNITTIPNNGNHPNFILKCRLPHYDIQIYPKLYKVTTIEELNVILQNVDTDYFMMEFHINENKLNDGNVSVIRSFNLIVPPNLNNLTLGNYKKPTIRSLDNFSTFDSNTFEILHEDKSKYLTTIQRSPAPKLGKTDLIEMGDETFKTGEELQVGDIIKTITIPNPNNIDLSNQLGNFLIDYETFSSGVIYSTNAVTSKIPVDIVVKQVRLLFTDGTFWGDNEGSFYLILRNNEVRFVSLNSNLGEYGIMVGDEIILLQHEFDEITITLKTLDTIIITTEMFHGYQISVEGNKLFLSRSDEGQSYVAIEHNSFCTYNECQDTSECNNFKPPTCCFYACIGESRD